MADAVNAAVLGVLSGSEQAAAPSPSDAADTGSASAAHAALAAPSSSQPPAGKEAAAAASTAVAQLRPALPAAGPSAGEAAVGGCGGAPRPVSHLEALLGQLVAVQVRLLRDLPVNPFQLVRA